jgi:hypothetical protein
LPTSSEFSHVPLSRRNAIYLVKSLSRASAPRSGGLGLHALIGLEKSLQPLCPSSEPPLSTRKPRDETVPFLYVSCPNFSEAARKEPKAAWRHLLLVLSQKGSILRTLDILPQEAQLPRYREALQQYLMADPPQLSERDFRR